MRTMLPVSVAGVALLLSGFATQAFGQNQGGYGQYEDANGRFEGGYSRNGVYGRYESNNNGARSRRGDLFETVRMDLEQAASQYSSRGDDNHFNSALDHLARFRDGMLRGEYRKGDLNKTIQQTQEVARGGSVPPELRSVLYRDLNAMRDYRSRMDRQRDSYNYGRRPYFGY